MQVKLLVLNEGVVSSGELLKNTCEMERKMTADAAQKFLKTAVKEHWFSEVSAGGCGLGLVGVVIAWWAWLRGLQWSLQ